MTQSIANMSSCSFWGLLFALGCFDPGGTYFYIEGIKYDIHLADNVYHFVIKESLHSISITCRATLSTGQTTVWRKLRMPVAFCK